MGRLEGRYVGQFSSPGLEPASLGLSFPGSRVPWDRCALAADFCAAFLADGDPEPGWTNAVSFLVNELVENAYKYGTGDTIDLAVRRADQRLTVEVSNGLTAGALVTFRRAAGILADPSTPRPRSLGEASGLGLFALVDFYQAELGFWFHGSRVTVQARFCLPLRENKGATP